MADNTYDVMVLLKNYKKTLVENPDVTEKVTVSAPDKATANKKAIAEAMSRFKLQEKDIIIKTVTEAAQFRDLPKTRGRVVETDSPTDVREVAGDILEKLQVSNEFAGMIAQYKKLTKLAAKFGGLGKVLTVIDVSNDILTLAELIGQFSQTNDKEQKKKLVVDITLITVKLTRTAVTIAFPATGIVDLGLTVCTMGYKAMMKSADAKAAESEEKWKDYIYAYEREKNALPSVRDGYYFELMLHARGVPMDDIMEIRRELQPPNFARDSNKNFKNPYRPMDYSFSAAYATFKKIKR